MKKRIITIASIAAAIVVLVLVYLWVIRPRVALYKVINEYQEFLPSLEKSAEYFTEYSVTNDTFVTIDNGYVSAKIPSTLKHYEDEAISYIYRNSDNSEGILFMEEPYDLSGMNLLRPENFEGIEGIPADVGVNEITKGFESLGNGLPNSAYGTWKCMALTDRSDYSFWNIKSDYCFLISAVMKEILLSGDDSIYIYENNDIYGLIKISEDDESYHITFDIYSADDLNTVHTLIIKIKSLDDAYAIINSVEFI